jgi:hypothetical protein
MADLQSAALDHLATAPLARSGHYSDEPAQGKCNSKIIGSRADFVVREIRRDDAEIRESNLNGRRRIVSQQR